jgi:hypothetical protein
LPTPINRPFHPDAGIQTSNLIFESAVGFISAATRQKAGRSVNGGPGASIFPGLYVSAVSDFAKVIVVSGNLRLVRLSHVAAFANDAEKMQYNKTRRLLHNVREKPASELNIIIIQSSSRSSSHDRRYNVLRNAMRSFLSSAERFSPKR